MKTEINIFLHRRDFRNEDNTALNALIEKYPQIPIMHIFIFNPIQITQKNPYFNKHCIEFMIQSLKEFKNELKDGLYFYDGNDTAVLKMLMSQYRVNALAFNLDYTPFARSRDEYLLNWCKTIKLETIIAEDYTIFKLGSILSNAGKPYEMYTPFYNKCLKTVIPESKSKKYTVFMNGKSTIKNIDVYYGDSNPNLAVKGGRQNALNILKHMKQFQNYQDERDFFYPNKTTKLAAYIKFGCVSIREVIECIQKHFGLKHGLIREIIWREFYSHVVWHNPHVFSKSFKPVNIKWIWKKEWYDKIMNANTGIPIIDAGIKELFATGWINNRMRMIIASFITKDLCMDWHLFEKDLFGRYLVDYDPSVNCLSWQGMASVGVDSTPYWRIINPWRQMEKFDRNLTYVKKWIGEVDKKNMRLHAMVDHEVQVKKYLQRMGASQRTATA